METIKVCYDITPESAASLQAFLQLVIDPSLTFRPLTSSFQNAANYVSESIQGTGAEASKEANKQVAKDSDASIGSRATAAKDAVFDKKDETSHNTKADVHKGK